MASRCANMAVILYSESLPSANRRERHNLR
jgi:hypothetical protein